MEALWDTDPGQVIVSNTRLAGQLLEVDLTAGTYDVRVEGNGSEGDVAHVFKNQTRIEVTPRGLITCNMSPFGSLDVTLVGANGQPEAIHASLEGGQPLFFLRNPGATSRVFFWVQEGDYTVHSGRRMQQAAIRAGAVKAVTLEPRPNK